MELVAEIVSTAFLVFALFTVAFALYVIVHLTFSGRR